MVERSLPVTFGDAGAGDEEKETPLSFQQDLADLARIVQRVRPAWAESAIRARLAILAEQGCQRGEALDAAIRCALDPSAATPVMIADPKYRTPVAKDDWEPRCEEHPTMRARRCPGCLGDVAAGERTEAEVGKRLLRPAKGEGRPITPEERERLRKMLSKASQDMPEDADTLQEQAAGA